MRSQPLLLSVLGLGLGSLGLFVLAVVAALGADVDVVAGQAGAPNRTYNDKTQVKLAFNPGAAVYIFPNVCATISFGLGGIQYTSITQKDADGNKIIATNVSLVERAVELAKLAGREIATAQEARDILGITRNCLRDEG